MQKLLRMMHKKEEGFTLVELMVVVVIIGILTAVAFVVFSNVTENAECTAHEANLRTINGAIMMYRSGEGAFPTDIGNLVGDYLDENPPSPFADTANAYELTGTGSDVEAEYSGTVPSYCD